MNLLLLYMPLKYGTRSQLQLLKSKMIKTTKG